MTSSQWREEAVGCRGQTRFLDALENIFYSSRQISDDLFLSVVKFITTRSLEAPPVLHHAPVTTFSLQFLAFPYFFFTKNDPWDAPRVDARGRRTVRPPLCTPLHHIRVLLGRIVVSSVPRATVAYFKT